MEVRGTYLPSTGRLPLISLTGPDNAVQTDVRARFGSLSRVYRLIGSGFWHDDWLQTRRRILESRADLMKKLVELNPTQNCN